MQVQTGVVSFAPTTIIFNAGKARIRGVEVEAFAELLRGLTLSLSYSHLDTKLLKQDDHRRDVLATGFTPEQPPQLSLSGFRVFTDRQSFVWGQGMLGGVDMRGGRKLK